MNDEWAPEEGYAEQFDCVARKAEMAAALENMAEMRGYEVAIEGECVLVGQTL